MTAAWTTDRMPNLAVTTVIVTGANSGMGLESARVFTAKGAHVVFAVRDEMKGRVAAATVSGSTEVRPLDLADLGSVREFAQNWRGGIHLLINKAGVLVPPFGHTKDGFELQFGINHLGHFALTNLLLPHITGRVVTVASAVPTAPERSTSTTSTGRHGATEVDREHTRNRSSRTCSSPSNSSGGSKRRNRVSSRPPPTPVWPRPTSCPGQKTPS